MSAPQMPEAWIDCAGMAERIGMSKDWVQTQVTANAIAHHRVGRYVRFSPADVAAFDRSTSVQPADRPRLRRTA